MYLDLGFLSPPLADWVAFQVVKGLKERLQVEPLQHLIRCNRPTEYPWCLPGDDFDVFWTMETAAHYRAALANLPDSIG